MKEFKGTPGPWVAKHNGYFYDIKPINEGQTLASVHENEYIDIDLTVQKHNANLIAAAPELLDVLSFIIDDCSRMIPKCAEEKARAAIARALGESE